MARPQLDIDGDMVEKLAAIGCKVNEIASILGCSDDTISRRYAGEFQKGRDNLRMSLRRKQIEVAMKGDRTLLIWLGKQYLDQADKVETKTEVTSRALTDEELAQQMLEVLMTGNQVVNPPEPKPLKAPEEDQSLT
jgi:hypothetical protein